MQRQQRLSRELQRLTKSPPIGVCVCYDESLKTLEVNLMGPANSPYKNGVFKLEIIVPENYPFSPPSIKFVTKIYHPNIDDSGRICMDVLKMPPSGCWRPTIGIEALLTSVKMLLENPNPDDPLMLDIAIEFKNNRKAFDLKAEEHTSKFAGGKQ